MKEIPPVAREDLVTPSTSTIRWVPRAAGLVVPEPHKRPRSSWVRSGAAAPNEVWQADFTHWRLADCGEVEIASWLDDHSRFLLGSRRSAASAATTWSQRSPPPATSMAGPPPRSPTFNLGELPIPQRSGRAV